MIIPLPAAVRPRVVVPQLDESVLLDEEVRERLASARTGLIWLWGLPGSGLSTAIAHLAHAFSGEPSLVLADSPSDTEFEDLLSTATRRLVICASSTALPNQRLFEQWRMALWARDEWIEYLLATHRDQCASVMQRVSTDARRHSLAGAAQLWQIALDRLALDDNQEDLQTALTAELHARLSDLRVRALVAEQCFRRSASANQLESFKAWFELVHSGQFSAGIRALVRHEFVQTILAAEFLAERLQAGTGDNLLDSVLSAQLLEYTAELIRGERSTISRLRKILIGRNRLLHPMAASLLHAARETWTPSSGRAPNLAGAMLPGLRWIGARFASVDVSGADLTGANFSESRFGRVRAKETQLSGAILHGAQLKQLGAIGANLSDADLSFVRAEAARFCEADLRGATLEGALLGDASFTSADLRGASFRRANLKNASIEGAKIANADFSGCNLSWASLRELVLRDAIFTGAQFRHATLALCDLEYMRLPGANFERADLCDALLTGSQMPDACFRNANLRGAGLADIEWERADLRGADLRESTFHLGSSRSGLVGSPIASEGSRTGFYTDEYQEQEFKAPEQIRKANLCGADLRGADIDGVDFYLVDLRGAHYTPEQEMHFRRCRAILEARV